MKFTTFFAIVLVLATFSQAQRAKPNPKSLSEEDKKWLKKSAEFIVSYKHKIFEEAKDVESKVVNDLGKKIDNPKFDFHLHYTEGYWAGKKFDNLRKHHKLPVPGAKETFSEEAWKWIARMEHFKKDDWVIIPNAYLSKSGNRILQARKPIHHNKVSMNLIAMRHSSDKSGKGGVQYVQITGHYTSKLNVEFKSAGAVLSSKGKLKGDTLWYKENDAHKLSKYENQAINGLIMYRTMKWWLQKGYYHHFYAPTSNYKRMLKHVKESNA